MKTTRTFTLGLLGLGLAIGLGMATGQTVSADKVSTPNPNIDINSLTRTAFPTLGSAAGGGAGSWQGNYNWMYDPTPKGGDHYNPPKNHKKHK